MKTVCALAKRAGKRDKTIIIVYQLAKMALSGIYLLIDLILLLIFKLHLI